MSIRNGNIVPRSTLPDGWPQKVVRAFNEMEAQKLRIEKLTYDTPLYWDARGRLTELRRYFNKLRLDKEQPNE